MRKTKFTNNEYYHIYNRGVDKRDVFTNEKDFTRFLKGMKEFNRVDPIGSLARRHPMPTDSEAVEIIAYCLNPNHFHLILKQVT